MAVTSFNETHVQPRDGGQTSADTREYRRRFVVQTNSVNDGPDTILSHIQCPRYGEVYVTPGEVNMGAVCVRVTCDASPENRNVWYVNAEYTSDADAASVAKRLSLPPLSRPAEVEFNFSLTETPLRIDRDDKFTNNTLGAPLNPLPYADAGSMTMQITKNLPSFDPFLWGTYMASGVGTLGIGRRPAVNQDAWAGGAPETWKFSRLSAVQRSERWNGADYSFWVVSVEVEYDPDKWIVSAENVGHVLIDNAPNNPNAVRDMVHARDEDGEVLSDPVQLDVNGFGLQQNQNGTFVVLNGPNAGQVGTPHVLKFKPYPKKPFGILGLL